MQKCQLFTIVLLLRLFSSEQRDASQFRLDDDATLQHFFPGFGG
jgi:hypothetical protein